MWLLMRMESVAENPKCFKALTWFSAHRVLNLLKFQKYYYKLWVNSASCDQSFDLVGSPNEGFLG